MRKFQNCYLCFCIVVFLSPYYCATVDELVKQWAPLIWLSQGEKFEPSWVEDFFNNVYVANKDGKVIFPRLTGNISRQESKDWYLTTVKPIEELLHQNNSFLYGKNPLQNSVPIYAVVNQCDSHKKWENDLQENGENYYFNVTYWIFYPYNQGKNICLVAGVPSPYIFNRCLGNEKEIGNHVGDWERVTMSFAGKTYPESIYLAVHETGGVYTVNENNGYMHYKFDHEEKQKAIAQTAKFADFLRFEGKHPIVFSALGSHGTWASPGEHEYNQIPKLYDKTSYGKPWKTWNNIKIYHLGKDALPYWMNYGGKWGNPKEDCFLFKKLGICQFVDGPDAIPREFEFCSS